MGHLSSNHPAIQIEGRSQSELRAPRSSWLILPDMRKKHPEKATFDTQPQLTRLHGLVKRVQRGDFPTQLALAIEWEKSPRTIQSDLDFIRDVWRMPLKYDRARHGYYFSEPVANFPMVPISEQELVSVFIAQKALQ